MCLQWLHKFRLLTKHVLPFQLVDGVHGLASRYQSWLDDLTSLDWLLIVREIWWLKIIAELRCTELFVVSYVTKELAGYIIAGLLAQICLGWRDLVGCRSVLDLLPGMIFC